MRLSWKSGLMMAPVAAAIVVSVVGWWTLRRVGDAVRGDLRGQLETALRANVTALEIWIRNQERLAGVLANDPEVLAAALAVLSLEESSLTNRPGAARSPEQTALQRELDQRLSGTTFLLAHLVNSNRMIVGGSGRSRTRPGQAVSEEHAARIDEVFESGRPVMMTPYKVAPRFPGPPGRFGGRPPFPGGRGSNAAGDRLEPGGGRRWGDRPGPPGGGPRPDGPGGRPPRELSFMQVVAPVKDATGATAGALAFILRPEEEFTRVLSVARAGRSGETFAFDPEGRMISQSRFDEDLKRLGLLTNAPDATSALTLELREPGLDLTRDGAVIPASLAERPLISIVAAAVEGRSGVALDASRDYRGVRTVGAWAWLPEQRFGVATKIDAAEAYQSLGVLRRLFAGLLSVLGLSVVAMGLVSYAGLVWRRRFDEARLKAKQLGQYTLEEKIGEGGMGVVYRAHHALLRRDTAIKLLLPDRADEASVRQFEHEVRLTCHLTHPNTIQIYDYGHTPDGIFYYAMELLPGLTLGELIERHGAQPQGRVIHFLTQVCGSLEEAHGRGLIHRDIKPGNILLCERGGVPDTVKVLDFGLVKRVQDGGGEEAERQQKHRGRSLVGTPLYMAPETILDSKAADVRSDLYAVGAVGYQLLTGTPVYTGSTVEEICEQHLRGTPEPLGIRSTHPVSPQLEALVLRCLEKDPAARPQAAGELGAALLKCPEAGAWTIERRIEWWQRHGNRVRSQDWMSVQPTGTGAATIKIDLADRNDSLGGTS